MTALVITLFFTFLIGVPIGVSLALASISTYVTNSVSMINSFYVYKNMVDGLNSYPFLAVPLFIFSGFIMSRGDMAKKLFEFFAYFMAKITAGLPITAVFTSLFYGALSGSGPATTAAVGSMAVPYLMDKGYEKNFCAALVATSGGLGVIIPPSIPFIIYAISANVSVADMFIAGIIPGIIIAITLSGTAYYSCKKNGENKTLLKESFNNLHKKSFLKVLMESFWALLTPVIVLGGIYGGFVTPTEAATVAVIYSLIVTIFIYKTIKIQDIPGILAKTSKSLAPIMAVVGAAVVFGRVVTLLRIPAMVAAFMINTIHSKLAIILIINVILLIAGMFVNTTSAILVLTPVLLPVALAIGIDPIHFGIMMVVNLAIGYVTPPVGLNLFVASGMFDIPILTLAKECIPFILAFMVALVFVIFIPWLSLALI